MRVDIGGGTRLFFDVVGGGLRPTDEALVEKPTLLLLHGGPGFDHSSFRPYFDRFADTHQVVYLDHRGQGRSDNRRQDDGWDLDTWADDVVRFCDALEITHPVVLGNSFGGFVAMRYASRHPEHPAKLVLSSTAARRYGEVSAARFEELGGPAARASYEQIYVHENFTLEAWAEYARLCMPLYNTRSSPFGPHHAWMNVRVLDAFTRTSTKMDLRDDVPTIRCPTLVLAGHGDPMTPPVASYEILALLPDGIGRLEVLDDCGHGTFRDQPDLTDTILRKFLAE